jgi:hypothetical protein
MAVMYSILYQWLWHQWRENINRRRRSYNEMALFINVIINEMYQCQSIINEIAEIMKKEREKK